MYFFEEIFIFDTSASLEKFLGNRLESILFLHKNILSETFSLEKGVANFLSQIFVDFGPKPYVTEATRTLMNVSFYVR